MKKSIVFLSAFFFAVSLNAHELFVETKNNVIKFKTDIADTREKQEYGLMFQNSIPNDYGMTFLYSGEKVISMWMKNTYIPLDMVFFDKQGYVVHIIKNAQPHDLSPKSSVIPVKGVIEMNGGLVEKNGISVGDKIVIK